MKFSKTDNTRVYVSKYKEPEERGDLYKSPQSKDQGKELLEKQITDRIEKANKLYSVFFAPDNVRDLEEHFKRIVSKVRNSRRGDVKEALESYTGYNYNDRGNKKFKNIKKYSYSVSGGKNLWNVMNLHVRERMRDEWQPETYRKAAVEVLLCICNGKNFKDSVDKLGEDTLADFKSACCSCSVDQKDHPEVYVPKNTGGIENLRDNTIERYFSVLMQTMAEQATGDVAVWQQQDELKKESVLEEKIEWLERCKKLTVNGKSKGSKVDVDLNKIKWKWATTDRLEAILVRMRRSLKRESNGEVAIALMQGLAQMDGKSLSSVIKEMKRDTEQYKKLKRFVDSVIRNYYHTDALRSIKRTDVKVQPVKQGGEDRLLALANEGKPQKAALNETLLKYASSKESSNQIMYDLKKLVFEYFSVKDDKPEKIWSIPTITEEFFDANFEDKEKKGERELGRPLYELWKEDNLNPNIAEIKNRIKYVNYGKYLQCLNKADNAFKKYWLKFIKEYVEKNYTGSRKIHREECYSTSMLSACWMDIIRFLCEKYIDIGKAVYHFAMPDDLPEKGEVTCGSVRDEYREGISSFDYEAIKAEETLQRDISVITVAAVSALSSSVIDEEKRKAYIEKENKKEKKKRKNLEDIMFLDAPLGGGKKDPDVPVLWNMAKENAKDQLLRFYGGLSSVTGIKEFNLKDEVSEQKFICELISHLKKIRNENFHYTAGKETETETEYSKLLWQNDQKTYSDLVKKRYYSNNTGMFYKEDDIRRLIGKLYSNSGIAESQIPAFRNVWKRKDLSEEIGKALSKGKGNSSLRNLGDDDGRQRIFGNALYFLLKEIYYNDFILNPDAKKYFFNAAKDYYNNNKSDFKTKYAVENFNKYIKQLEGMGNNLTFGGVCQMIMHEYSQQNTRKGETEIFKHFKMLFPKYVKNAFVKFIEKNEENYGFLKNPVSRELPKEKEFLPGLSVPSMKFPDADPQLVAWYTLAHFIHPRQLNLLIGDFKSYVQYRQDIARRMDCAQEIRDKNALKIEVRSRTQYAQSVLNVLEFVRETAGRVSNCFTDYYVDENAYADYLSQYVAFEKLESADSFGSLRAFCQNTLPDGTVIDVYADEKNPKVLRNIELARMYAGGDLPLQGRELVSAKEIRDYYAYKAKVEKILNKGLCKDKDEQKTVMDQQRRRERIILNDVTDMYAIVSDLLGQLTSLSYLRERDYMYLYLGFYYMAMQTEGGWGDEFIISAELSEKCSVKRGLVLYQVLGVFDYGVRLPINSEGNWSWQGGALPDKLMSFYGMHKESMNCAMRLFGKETKLDAAVILRDYVDHGKYYASHSKSITGLYSEVYNLFFTYSQKLRNSVAYNFKSTLERYFVEAKLKYGKDISGFELDKLDSAMFTYKLQDGKTCEIKAKDDKFLEELKAVLKYSS